MAYTLISAQTDAVATKAGFAVRKVPATLFATGLAGVEECDIFISEDEGATWTVLSTAEAGGASAARKLIVGQMAFEITSHMYIGVTKDATVGAAGVFLSDEANV